MGFFGSLFGSDQKKTIRRSTAAADRILQSGQRSAQGALDAGFNRQRTALQGGYNRARGALDSGFDAARGDMTGQFGRAEDALTDAQAYVQQVLSPFMQSGQRAQGLYDTALGLDGQEAAQEFYQGYAANDPFREFNEDMTNKAMARSFNASGALGSGRAAMAASRANLERGSTDLNRYLDRLASQGAQGGQYASQIATNAANTGAGLANIRTNLGTGLAGLEENRGVRLGALDYGYGADRGAIGLNQGQARAGLTYGNAQQRAGNRVGAGNAIANVQSQSANNLIGLGSAILTGLTPGAYGTSAFGNMINGKFL